MGATAVYPKEALFALLHPIFRDAVDPDRYDLSTPFVVGDFVYASDHLLIVRSPVTPEITEAFAAVQIDPSRLLKNPASVYELSGFLPDPTPLPGINSLPVCAQCRGDGRQGPYECSNCGHSAGVEDCPVCRGFGRGNGFDGSIDLGEFTISHAFFMLLSSHGAVLYGPADDPKGERPAKFTISPDVEGRVMPMARD